MTDEIIKLKKSVWLVDREREVVEVVVDGSWFEQK